MNKKHFSIYIFILLLLFISHLSITTVRYVSKIGSSTPPYISWATSYNDDIISGMYIYQSMVYNGNRIPVFSGMKKMMVVRRTDLRIVNNFM
jgi:hypothetical protein